MVGAPDPANDAEALDPRALGGFRAFALVAALAVPALGGIVLAGYVFDDQRVIAIARGLQGMSPLTAVVASALLGGNLVMGYDPLSAPLANAVFAIPDGQSGSTSVATAVCFI